MAAAAMELTPHAEGVYFTLNPVHRDLLSRVCNRVATLKEGQSTSDKDILGRRWFLIDLDPRRTSGISSTYGEKELAYEVAGRVFRELKQRGWPDPVMCDSGNGFHLLYRVDLPAEDEGLIVRCVKALVAKFGTGNVEIDTTVSNPARICKLYGSWARKGDDTSERPHRRARILEIPKSLEPVTADLLEALAAEAPAPGARPVPLPVAAGPDVLERARRYLAKMDKAVSGEKGHNQTFKAACTLVLGFALPTDQAYPILEEWNRTHCEPPWTERELRHKLDDAAKQEGLRGWLRLKGAGGDSSSISSLSSSPHGPDPRTDDAVALDVSSLSSSPPDGEPPVEAGRWPDPPERAAYRGVAGDLVRTLAPHTEADPAALLVQFLVAFGNLVGRGPFFVAESARHYTNIFAIMVGRTSKGRKGTSWSQVRRLACAADPNWADHRVQSGLSSGEGLIWAVRDEIQKVETLRDKGVAVGQQTVTSDPGVADKRLLALEGEFALVLKVLARDTNTLSATIRHAWDTGDLRTLTKNSPAKATGAHISIIGHITRDEIRKLLTETDMANGFGNRFLWVAVRRSRSLPFGGDLAPDALEPYLKRLESAVRFARGEGEIRRDAGADALWAREYDRLSAGRPGLVGAILGRAEAQTMRLALLYALLDWSATIRVEHLRAALAVWEYCERSALHIFGDSTGDKALDALLRALRGAPGGLTRTEISEQVFHRNKAAFKISQLLAKLLEHDLAHQETTETGGRPAERWHAGPAPSDGARLELETPDPSEQVLSPDEFMHNLAGLDWGTAGPAADAAVTRSRDFAGLLDPDRDEKDEESALSPDHIALAPRGCPDEKDERNEPTPVLGPATANGETSRMDERIGESSGRGVPDSMAGGVAR
jgi:hypothetical protein